MDFFFSKKSLDAVNGTTVSAGFPDRRRLFALSGFVLAAIFLGVFLYSLTPPAAAGFKPITFRVVPSEGFLEIVSRLSDAGLIRSREAFILYAIFSGAARHFHEGVYYMREPQRANEIAARLSESKRAVSVRIPEGSTVRNVDATLSEARVIPPGSIIALDKKEGIEGHLFPDTYQFYLDSDPQDVLKKFLDNFNAKAMPILLGDKTRTESNLILASLIEKEVPDYTDQQIVAGILRKRIARDIPLQIDATVCYVKVQILLESASCYPLSPSDFQVDSPYNTYRVRGLPPTAIGSPSVSAIKAAMNPVSSPYLYYLSDPRTGKTIFAKTLDEQANNRAKYLR